MPAFGTSHANGCVVVPFTWVDVITITTTVNIITAGASLINPTNSAIFSPRLNAIAALFDSFRFTKLRFDFLCADTTSGLSSAILAGYTQDVYTTAAPATAQAVSQMPIVSALALASTAKGQSLMVPPAYLRQGSIKWWKTTGATDSFETNQGQLYAFFTTAQTGVVNLFTSGTCVFKDPNANGESVPRLMPPADCEEKFVVLEQQPRAVRITEVIDEEVEVTGVRARSLPPLRPVRR